MKSQIENELKLIKELKQQIQKEKIELNRIVVEKRKQLELVSKERESQNHFTLPPIKLNRAEMRKKTKKKSSIQKKIKNLEPNHLRQPPKNKVQSKNRKTKNNIEGMAGQFNYPSTAKQTITSFPKKSHLDYTKLGPANHFMGELNKSFTKSGNKDKILHGTLNESNPLRNKKLQKSKPTIDAEIGEQHSTGNKNTVNFDISGIQVLDNKQMSLSFDSESSDGSQSSKIVVYSIEHIIGKSKEKKKNGW